MINQENPAPPVFLDFAAHGHKHRHRSFSMHRLMHHFLTAPGLDHLPGPWDWSYQTIQENMLPESLAPVSFTWRQSAFENICLSVFRWVYFAALLRGFLVGSILNKMVMEAHERFLISRGTDMMDFLCKVCKISALLSVGGMRNAHIGGRIMGFSRLLCT